MKNAVYIKLPRTGSTTIWNVLEKNNVKYYGGCHMGYWGDSKYNIQTNTSPHLYECVFNFIGKKIYDESYTFSSVRNPYSRAVSMYTHFSWDSVRTFKEFCIAIKKGKYPSECAKWHSSSLTKHITCGDKLMVDYVIRFENLQEDFNTICDKIEIPRKGLPHKNATKRKHYTEYYDDETREIIAEKFAKDIEYFGYEFGE